MTTIYLIMHNATGRCYVGRDLRYPRRINEHISGTSKCKYICRAIKRYGVSAFTFTIVQEVPNDCAVEAEEYWIDYFDGYIQGFNLTPLGKGGSVVGRECSRGKAHGNYGRIHTDDAKRKMSSTRRGKSRPDLAEWKRQWNLTDNPMRRPEVREKNSEAQKKNGIRGEKHPSYGKKRPDTVERNKTNNAMKCPEVRKKHSESMRGEKNPMSRANREKRRGQLRLFE